MPFAVETWSPNYWTTREFPLVLNLIPKKKSNHGLLGLFFSATLLLRLTHIALCRRSFIFHCSVTFPPVGAQSIYLLCFHGHLVDSGYHYCGVL